MAQQRSEPLRCLPERVGMKERVDLTGLPPPRVYTGDGHIRGPPQWILHEEAAPALDDQGMEKDASDECRCSGRGLSGGCTRS